MMIVGFLAARFLNDTSLLHACVMALPFDSRVIRASKYAAHRLTNLENLLSLISGPDAKNIFSIAHAQHDPTDLVRLVTKLVANAGHDEILIEPIGNAFL